MNNHWGEYQDILEIQFEKWVTRSLPVQIQIVGTPLYFSGHSIIHKHGTSSLKFGYRLREADPLQSEAIVAKKIVHAVNRSPKEIQIDWNVFYSKEWDPNRPCKFNFYSSNVLHKLYRISWNR